ncbi:MAG: type II secretion system protein [Phycisphaerae bacterium]|jgi:hypothetical protein
MKYRSETISLNTNCRRAFTIAEVVAATAIVGIIASSILVIFSRCASVVRDTNLKTQAFEVARENMEKLLGSSSVMEQVVYGYSDKYPAIQWINKVETFYEPVKKEMWLRAICSAQFKSSDGQDEEVEFTHWLTKLTDEQVRKILEARQQIKEAVESGELQKLDKSEPKQAPAIPELPDDLSNMTADDIRKLFETKQ